MSRAAQLKRLHSQALRTISAARGCPCNAQGASDWAAATSQLQEGWTDSSEAAGTAAGSCSCQKGAISLC